MKTFSIFAAATLLAAPTYAQCGTPDALEDNDDCLSAVAIPGNAATGLNVEDIDLDFFTITVQDQERVTIDVSFIDDLGDIDAYLWDPVVACDSLLQGEGFNNGSLTASLSADDNEQLVYDNFTGAAQNLIVEVRLWSGETTVTCSEYDINVTFGPGVVSPCATPDALEDNDDCNTAVAVPGNSATGLNVSDLDRDFYAVTVQDMERLTVDATFINTDADLDIYLWDPLIDCDSEFAGEGLANGSLAQGFSADDNETFDYDNSTGAAQNLILEVRIWSGDANDCGTYDLDLAFGSIPPSPCLNPDQFEPNIDCSTATPITDGTYTGLNLEDTDNDYYAIIVPAGGTLDVTVSHLEVDGDMDVWLWDPLVVCDTNINGNTPGNGDLANAFTYADDEVITYTNATGADQNLVLEVDMFDAPACNTYDLTISGTIGGGPQILGTQFCPAANNSTGAPGVCEVFGFSQVATNDVTLRVNTIPVGQFGIFVVSQTTVPPVPVADGFLCLGGAIGRYQQTSQIWQADAMGMAELAIDLTMIPQPMGNVAAAPGDSWSFQAWNRDSSPAGANFTTGSTVTFN